MSDLCPFTSTTLYIVVLRTTIGSAASHRLIAALPTRAAAREVASQLGNYLRDNIAGSLTTGTSAHPYAFEMHIPDTRYIVQVVELQLFSEMDEMEGIKEGDLEELVEDKGTYGRLA
jgi:hypothetical protein